MKIYLTLVSILGTVSVTISQAIVNPHTLLWTKLKANYSKNVMPYTGQLPYVVNIAFNLARLEGLDEKRQVLNTFGWIIMSWYDPVLRWNPAQAYGIEKLVVPATEIWLPEIAMLNSAVQGNDLSLDSKFKAAVGAPGFVTWAPGFKWETACDVDLEIFPFDSQTCYLNFTNWMHTGDHLNYSLLMGKKVMLSAYQKNPEWSILSATQGVFDMSFPESKETIYPVAYFKLVLKRNPTYFALNVVVPAVLMMTLTLFVFMLPVGSGEKVSLAISVLLSFTVVLLMVSDITPRNGKKTPLVSMFITAALILSGISLVVSVWVVAITHHSPHTPVPRVLQKLCRVLSRVGCLHSEAEHVFKFHSITQVTPKHNGAFAHDTVQLNQNGDAKEMKKPRIESMEMKDSLDELRSILKDFVDKLGERKEEEEYSAQWKFLGKIIDRMFLIVYVVGGIGMNIYFWVKI